VLHLSNGACVHARQLSELLPEGMPVEAWEASVAAAAAGGSLHLGSLWQVCADARGGGGGANGGGGGGGSQPAPCQRAVL
jgi:hypothetical protein